VGKMLLTKMFLTVLLTKICFPSAVDKDQRKVLFVSTNASNNVKPHPHLHNNAENIATNFLVEKQTELFPTFYFRLDVQVCNIL
jgi:hypothetical protein